MKKPRGLKNVSKVIGNLSAGDASDSLINLTGKLDIGHGGVPNLVYSATQS